jgi:hypothetical protein
MTSPLRIIVTGLVGLHPVGGVAWDYLHYVIGLARLGHDVYYYEDTWDWPYHPVERQATADGSYSAQFLAGFFARYAPNLTSHWHYYHLHETSYGMDRAAFVEVARNADVFLNVSGAVMIPDELSPHCVKVFLDTDPGYNQIIMSERLAGSEDVDRWTMAGHDRLFTYAENIHGDDCTIPHLGFRWKTTRFPLVADYWEPLGRVQAPGNAPWTTVMTWNAFKKPLFYHGVEYKSKGSEFEKILDLPQHLKVPLKVALGGVKPPFELLASNGWQVADAPEATLTPQRYQDFIADSRGEISTAKHVYVAMRSGWFSCRSACYLGAGRPVVVQDTGFSRIIPVGQGILAFSSREEAQAAVEAVESNYAMHCRAALELADDLFSADKVLPRMIEDIFADDV